MPSDGKPADVSAVYCIIEIIILLKSTAATGSKLNFYTGMCVRRGLVVCEEKPEPTSSQRLPLPPRLRPRQRETSETIITEVMKHAQ